ncbi:hypothetical protein D3C85_886820 [compost metagenome]
MELALIVWAVGTLPSLASGLCFIFFVLALLAAIAHICCKVFSIVEDREEDKQQCKELSKIFGCILFITAPIWFVCLLVPDEDTAYQMLAAYGVQSVVENEKAQELVSDGADVLKALMAKAKKELEKERAN